MHFARVRPVFREHHAGTATAVRLGRTPSGWAAVTLDGTLLVLTPTRSATLAAIARLGLARLRGRPTVARRATALGTPFQHKIWQACLRIPAGRTATYGEIAKSIRCRSAQAVGQALGRNPLCRIIPCHRVIGQGTAGGFAWGRTLKQRWLKSEVA